MSERTDLSTREGVSEFLEWIFVHVREDLVESGELRPRAWIFVQRDPKTGDKLDHVGIAHVITPDFRGHNDEKNALADMIRKIAVRTKAVGVALAMEVWCADDLSPARVRELGPRGLEDLPASERQEAIYLSLDHLAFGGERCWRAMITRDPKGRPAVGEFEEQLNVKGRTGRFPELFPREHWQ